MYTEIPVTNQTMELADCRDAWFFDEKYQCWCLEDVLYTDRATTPKFQRLSVFVPAPYMKEHGVIDPEGQMNGYSARTAPVILQNNSAGYMQMPHMWLGGPRCSAPQYLERGFVFVTCGNRGRESKDSAGRSCGKAPMNLVDLKTVIRFLRHNRESIPGDLGRIISIGASAGGAMSSLLAVTGNHADFDPYLRENGAFMDERDDIFAAQIYCPIIDLEHADPAYEWAFFADHENESSHAGPAGVMTPFQEALSAELKERYIRYFNDLGLTDPATGEILAIHEDGRSGSGYEYLMRLLNDSASDFLRRLKEGTLGRDYSAEDYLSGNYEYQTEAPMDGPGDGDGSDLLQGHAGPGVALAKADEGSGPAGRPSLGDLVSRPPKGVPYRGMEPPMVTVRGTDKSGWLSWDGQRAQIRDLDSYVLNYRRRMKPCTAFDALGMDSGENEVFGTEGRPYVHFNSEIADAVLAIKDRFPEEAERYYEAFAEAGKNEELRRRAALYNPLNYIGEGKGGDSAQYCRIRVGSHDADTALSVSMTLALRLAQAGRKVDYALVWDQPHCEADYPGELCDWIEKICGQQGRN